MAEAGLSEALVAFGHKDGELPRPPILHGTAGTLVTFGVPSERGAVEGSGVWISGSGVRFVGWRPAPTGGARAHGLTGPSADLFDLFLGTARGLLERIEEIDARLAEVQGRGRTVPLPEIWSLQRRIAQLRAQIGRALVGLAELSVRNAAAFPGFSNSMPSVSGELERVRALAANVQQSLSDLILLRNAEESNRIAEAANQLSRTSNRIASLANTSNIRMLGLTYIALVLGLVSAAVLIPNTGATILGMPSAAWVPGLWVDVVLVLLAVVPIVVIFSRPWVRRILDGLGESETRAGEGIQDLPEVHDPQMPQGPPRL